MPLHSVTLEHNIVIKNVMPRRSIDSRFSPDNAISQGGEVHQPRKNGHAGCRSPIQPDRDDVGDGQISRALFHE
jgi:hypothetical protein